MIFKEDPDGFYRLDFPSGMDPSTFVEVTRVEGVRPEPIDFVTDNAGNFVFSIVIGGETIILMDESQG